MATRSSVANCTLANSPSPASSPALESFTVTLSCSSKSGSRGVLEILNSTQNI